MMGKCNYCEGNVWWFPKLIQKGKCALCWEAYVEVLSERDKIRRTKRQKEVKDRITPSQSKSD